MKLNPTDLLAAGKARVAEVEVFERRIRESLDDSRRMGVLSGTMIRDGDDGPMIVKMGSHPLSIKKLTIAQLREWAEEAGIPWEDGYEDRLVQVWASDERVDRDGDIVEQSWDFANYAKNPLVLWGHEWGAPPIGNSIHWSVEERSDEGDNYSGPALMLVELFAPEEASPQAESVLRLAKAGFLRSGSVGFYPGQVISVEDDEAREELGIPEGGYLLRDNELIEHSHCSVPANPGALNILAAAKAAGGLRPMDVAVIRELARQDALLVGREDVWARMDSALRRAWKGLYPNVAIEDHKPLAHPVEPDSAFERGCTGAELLKVEDEPVEPDADKDELTLEAVAADAASALEAVANLAKDVDDLKSSVADLRSDFDEARRDDQAVREAADEERSEALRTLLSDLTKSAGKALAKTGNGS